MPNYKWLFRDGRPVFHDGKPVFVDVDSEEPCPCCETVGGTCNECFDAVDSIILTFSGTLDGTSLCGTFWGTVDPPSSHYEYWPWIAYSFDGSFELPLVSDYGIIKFFEKVFGTYGDDTDPGRLVQFLTGPLQNTRIYLVQVSAIARCNGDGLLEIVSISASFQWFYSFPTTDDVRVYGGRNSQSYGDAGPIDTTENCCTSADTSPFGVAMGCEASETFPGAGPRLESEIVVNAKLCGSITPPDPPPDDPDPPPPTEDPDPPDPPPPEPPTPADCTGLSDCMAMPDATLEMFNASDYSEPFTGGLFGLDGTYYWLLSNLNFSITLPYIGGSYSFEAQLYTPGTHATAVSDGKLIRYAVFDASAADPTQYEHYVYKVRGDVTCVDGVVIISNLKLSFDEYIGAVGLGTPLNTSNGQFDVNYASPILITVLETGAGDCFTGVTISQVSFDGDLFTPVEGTSHTFNVAMQIGGTIGV